MGTRPNPPHRRTHRKLNNPETRMLSAPIPPVVNGTILRTAGAEQVVVTRCPGCNGAHRHLAVGLRVPPCGQPYVINLDSPKTA
jgi:hypothetical protein